MPTGPDSPARREQSARAGQLRGIGMASFSRDPAAPAARPGTRSYARFDAQGDLHLYAVSQSGGQGHETTFVNILADELGISGERVHFHEGDPDVKVVGNGTGGSRSLYGAGSAFKLLGPKIIETAKPHAAAALGAEAAAVQYAAACSTPRAAASACSSSRNNSPQSRHGAVRFQPRPTPWIASPMACSA